MLVLTRKADDQILIGDDIKITLVRVRGNSVRIGIDAPKHVRVVRAELAVRDANENSVPVVERKEVFVCPEAQSKFAGATTQVDTAENSRSVSISGTIETDEVHGSSSNTNKTSATDCFVKPASIPDTLVTTKPAPLSAFVSAT